MKHHIGKACLITLSIFLASGASNANVAKSEAVAKPAASTAKAESGAKNGKPKAAAVKAVDINSAGKAELMTLPGIDAARADKIIAGRPYLSKAFLVTRNIIPAGVYENIRRQIIAKQK